MADRLHSAFIHLLRHARRQDDLSRQAPARLSALSVLVFGGPKTLGELAAAEQVKAPTMSRIVAGLHRASLAQIETDPADARKVRIQATRKGERLLQAARQRRIQVLVDAFKPLKARQLDLLQEAAGIIESAISASVARSPNK